MVAADQVVRRPNRSGMHTQPVDHAQLFACRRNEFQQRHLLVEIRAVALAFFSGVHRIGPCRAVEAITIELAARDENFAGFDIRMRALNRLIDALDNCLEILWDESFGGQIIKEMVRIAAGARVRVCRAEQNIFVIVEVPQFGVVSNFRGNSEFYALVDHTQVCADVDDAALAIAKDKRTRIEAHVDALRDLLNLGKAHHANLCRGASDIIDTAANFVDTFIAVDFDRHRIINTGLTVCLFLKFKIVEAHGKELCAHRAHSSVG